ncbi:mitochondrial translation protein [Penicillium capsulatum]|uniref:Mitochondrial translation protein n=1 Tax=Penicillium capsulatum TaxID=69766 RepID=A0A9W9IJK4_9EURO|nr:mitochondrial translation protein [Penicillium capsulatum]KAJ6121908.1 mitochondrial translation protein [Penicillium capsulatum]
MPVLRDGNSDSKSEGPSNDAPTSYPDTSHDNEVSDKKSSGNPTNKDNQQLKGSGEKTESQDSKGSGKETKPQHPQKSGKSKRKPSKKGNKGGGQKTGSTPKEAKDGEGQKTQSKASKKEENGPNPKRFLAKVNELLAANPSMTEQSNPTPSNTPKPKPELSHLASFIQQKHAGSFEFDGRAIKPLDIPTPPVPRLSFGLDRVLFNPGVYQLRDPRSRVYNFDPYLGSIMPVTEFDFQTLKEYITSSKDRALRNIAVKEKKKYVGSSSSMTSVLSHFHYLLSGWRAVDTRTISQGFPEKMRSFTRLLRSPAAMFLHYQDGVYAIDADKEFDSANILMNLGKSMEKLLTLPKEDFERYRRSSENKITQEEEEAVPESYHYSTYGDFIMRSQLDAHDPRLPGTGMFDLKTRAVVSIRMDALNFEHGLGYEIKSRFGNWESFEREYYDMIRAAFLKYSLQVRIGRMDGIFVAFHNIERMFGFQYVSLPEMDQALHGQSDTTLGDAEFQLSLDMWNEVLNKATEKFPKQSLRFHFETRDAATPFMYVFAEPVSEDQIQAIQTRNAAKIEAYQQRLLNLTPKDDGVEEPNPESQPESAAASDVKDPGDKKGSNDTQGEIFGLAIIARNKVNGQKVDRPASFASNDKWTVEYEMNEMAPAQSWGLYKMVQNRRQKDLDRGEGDLQVVSNAYIQDLRRISQQGRLYRQHQNEIDHKEGIVTFDDALK